MNKEERENIRTQFKRLQRVEYLEGEIYKIKRTIAVFEKNLNYAIEWRAAIKNFQGINDELIDADVRDVCKDYLRQLSSKKFIEMMIQHLTDKIKEMQDEINGI